MGFRWIEWNIKKVEEHRVLPVEAERVVLTARRPYPKYGRDGTWLVWGRGRGGRPVQAVFVLDEDGEVFIIHARPLTRAEVKRFRKQE